MVDLLWSAGGIAVALFLVLLNGFFVASEFAFVRVRSTSVEQLAEEGRPGSEVLQEVMDKLDDYLAVTQLGITVSSLGLGWVGEPAVAALIEPFLAELVPAGVVHLLAFALGFGFITFLHVVFGELAPKTLAIAEAERLSLFVAPPMKFFYLLFYPGLVVFNGAANAFTSALGVPPASETEETLGEREIRRVLSRSGERGHVDASEVEMIERVFELDDITVREVMVPRPDVVAVSEDTSLEQLRETVLEAGHTRYPVVDSDDENQVVGFVDVKDALQGWEDGDSDVTVGDISRDIVVVPETEPVDGLLLRFRDEHRQMAAVIDEWGSFEGLVTVEDAVESVVGDLYDEFDEAGGSGVDRLDDGSYVLDPATPLSDLERAVDATLSPEDGVYTTAGGLVLDELGREPEVGDEVEVGGYVFEVTEVDGTRISGLRMYEEG